MATKLLHHFSLTTSSSASTISSMKLKTMIHTLIFSHICRMARALSKAKSILANILKDTDLIDNIVHFKKGSNKHYKHHHHKVKVYGSFRLHYNWCTSEPASLDKFSPAQFYYDSTWSSAGLKCKDESSSVGLSGYLHWLEEKPDHMNPTQNSSLNKSAVDLNEIDKLADVFIASCHEKFRLEKQESCRRFQEMMARSM